MESEKLWGKGEGRGAKEGGGVLNAKANTANVATQASP